MVVKVNPEIGEYIDNLEYDKKIKDCLKDILDLELKRYKEDITQYTVEYNRIIERYLERWNYDIE